MNFISICSGIEAASVAFGPLGWKATAFSEIDPFPCAVLAHHYPDVPNFGDMTKFREWPEEIFANADAVVGGPPCQAFSVAGLRNGLNDARGNLTLTYAELIDHADAIRTRHGKTPVVVLYENVPGLLSTADNAFGCFLAGLAGEDDPLVAPGGKWTNAGYVLGPKRAIAWRVLDAQYFGVAQRRRRVFVVASARTGFDPAAVLFEFDGMRRDTAPSREAGEVAAAGAGAGAAVGFHTSGGLVPGIARCVTTGEAKRQDYETCTFIAHSLRGEGSDASQANGGGQVAVAFAIQDVRGTDKAQNGRGWNDDGTAYTLDTHATQGVAHVLAPIAAYAIQAGALRTNPNSGPDGVGVQADHAYTLEARAEVQAVAFAQNTRDEVRLMGGDGQIVGALAAEPGMKQTCYVAQSAVAHSVRLANTSSNGWGIQEEVTHTLDCTAGPAVQAAMQVRRLTPVECERLQGFPEIKKTATITVLGYSNSNVCLSDQPSTNVLAALQSHKSPSNASPAEESVFPSNASAAALNLSASQASSSVPVLVSAQIDLERRHLRLHSQEKLLLSASIADANEWCLLPIQAGDFAHMSAVLLSWLEKKTPRGKVESHLNTSGSFPLLIGNLFANQSGREIEELASDAGKFMSAVKKCTTSITSEAGRNSQNFESNLQTLLCSVTTAISSFIPREIRSASSYALSIEVSHGYTLIPWRKKPAEDCPDGPRYRALGNSWAVPNIRWIGRRIDSALSRGQTQPSHVEAAQMRSTPRIGEQHRDRMGS